jgi:hypothetical protein
VACRPKVSSSVNALLFFEVASSTNWHFGLEQFAPTYFINISNYLHSKELALSEYRTELETYPDCRSLENLAHISLARGSFVGFEAAEAFQIAYIRE